MNLLRGSWNVTEDDTPVHSPVRLLQKLAAYRASTGSPSQPSSPSPSPQNDRKSTILTESTNFFSRLWRPNAQHPSPSPSILIASHETASSSSFDHIPEPSPSIIDISSSLSPSTKSNRRMSVMREISSKSPPQLFPFLPSLPPQSLPLSLPSPPPPLPLPPPPLPIQPQPTSSTVTDPSFEDTTSDHPCDTASEYYSQSFEANLDSINPGIDDEQSLRENHGLTYDERYRRLSLSAKPVIPFVQQIPSLPIRFGEQHHGDSLASPEANIDVSMVSLKYKNKHCLTREYKKNLTHIRKDKLFYIKDIYI